MSLDFLTPAEIRKVTGKVKKSAQMRALRQLGYTARPDANGEPLVLRAHAEAKFGHPGSPKKRKRTAPDWSHIDAKAAQVR